MLYSATTALAFVAAALAQTPTAGFDAITKPTKDENVPAGSTYQITWDVDPNHSGAINIGLLGGATPGTLNLVETIATHVNGTAGSYDWHVASTLGNLATYGIQINLVSDTTIFQWGNPFHIVGGSSTGGGSTSTGGSGSVSTSTGSTGLASSTAVSSATSSGNATSAASTSTSVVVVSSSTSAPSSSFVAPSSTVISATVRGNFSTTATGLHTTITSVVTQGATPTKSSSPNVVTNGVGSVAAGSFALVGGVAMAVLAL